MSVLGMYNGQWLAAAILAAKSTMNRKRAVHRLIHTAMCSQGSCRGLYVCYNKQTVCYNKQSLIPACPPLAIVQSHHLTRAVRATALHGMSEFLQEQ